MKSQCKYPDGVEDVGHMYTDMISVYICISSIDLTGFSLVVINTSHKLPHTMKLLHLEFSAQNKPIIINAILKVELAPVKPPS